MAFVRWRGTCAELLATVYENGRSRQILLANLPGPYASFGTRLQVTREHPDISIDWLAVDRALARGPNDVHPVEPAMTVAQVESLLRGFAQQLVQGDRLTRQAAILLDAADVLFTLRDKHPGETADLSSDDKPRPPPRGAGQSKPQAP